MGVVLPVPDGEGGQASVLLVPWADWETLIAAAPQVWAYQYGEDGGTLVVRGYRAGDCWLSLDFTALSEDPLGLDELLDEEGLFPDGSPGPGVALERSRQSVAAAREAGDLTSDLAKWLLAALEGEEGDAEVLAATVPARLGFVPLRWLNPDDLGARDEAGWREGYPGVLTVR
ncbi:hypothetical protein Dcar01_01709 [Deinococcus carri]|uniref:DUF2094 domain-containing protein n=2 Tax=Deinococcus carri TaxID=1211323 RepID=A0ABP9W6J2_9DEIO